MLNFKKLNLHPSIIDALEKKGYSTPTPIQEEAIPHLIAGKDLLGIAQTGTGKTAAFALPILDKLSKNHLNHNKIRALILTPTRELAVQIADNIKLYSAKLNLKYAVIFGGVNEASQIRSLKNGVDIVVATPGRLLDLTSQGFVSFSQVEIFVLDEADRMLDMGFIHDIKKIIAKLPKEKQSILFSATMPKELAGLVNSILKDPIKIEITPPSTTVEKINQKVYLVEKAHKSELLLDIITKEDVIATLVFCKTKRGANKVADYLKEYGVLVSAIHGNKSQAAREKSLKDLRAGTIKILIATDIAARGIDVSSISHVINYDIPLDPESYVHRIGRTARAGREGIAISLCDPSENQQLRIIEKTISMKIPVDNSHNFYKKSSDNKNPVKKDLAKKSYSNGFKKSSDDKNHNNSNRSNSNYDNSSDKEYSQARKPRPNRFNKNPNQDGDLSKDYSDSRKPKFGRFNNKNRSQNPEINVNRDSWEPRKSRNTGGFRNAYKNQNQDGDFISDYSQPKRLGGNRFNKNRNQDQEFDSNRNSWKPRDSRKSDGFRNANKNQNRDSNFWESRQPKSNKSDLFFKDEEFNNRPKARRFGSQRPNSSSWNQEEGGFSRKNSRNKERGNFNHGKADSNSFFKDRKKPFRKGNNNPSHTKKPPTDF